MKPIVTLTLNPSIDGSAETDVVRHTRKVRTANELLDPGGGGLNVARVLGELGAPAYAIYCAGGATGDALDSLLEARGVERRRVPVAGVTRFAHVVRELSTGREFRFVPEGPEMNDAEVEAVLEALVEADCDYLVASGSLPRGVAQDFYARVSDVAARKGAKFILDTSGEPLRQAIARGGVHFAKPSRGEFAALIGETIEDQRALGEAALRFVEDGRVEMLAVTLGHEGAVFASREGVRFAPALDVPVVSAVGAGDSFVAGFVFALATGKPPQDAFLMGVAAGSAAVMTPGTQMCRRDDVERLYAGLKSG
ncbi:MAG: 1-phosphofructokinase family hexose kinase [Salinarimonadaceae bacterium]|nr:MAG: 1-phosphofructokinase family hexose kinase [Salinarimonadaceae bacterium]